MAAYSELFNGAFNTLGWLADSGAFTSGAPGTAVSFSMLVTAGQLFNLVVYNPTASQEGVQDELELSSPVQPPRLFRTTSVAGNTVTFRWLPPLHGPTPSDYAIDGGLTPGQVLATVPLGEPESPVRRTRRPERSTSARLLADRRCHQHAVERDPDFRQPGGCAVDALAVARHGVGVVGRFLLGEHVRRRHTDRAGARRDRDPRRCRSRCRRRSRASRSPVCPGGPIRSACAQPTPRARVPRPPPSTSRFPASFGVPQPPANFLAYRVGNAVTVAWDAGHRPGPHELHAARVRAFSSALSRRLSALWAAASEPAHIRWPCSRITDAAAVWPLLARRLSSPESARTLTSSSITTSACGSSSMA